MATYQQIDWTGEQPANDSTDRCPTCNGIALFTLGVGRPSIYCSDACKMKAYRQRQKTLRNTPHKEPLLNHDDIPFSDSIATLYSRLGWYNLYGRKTTFEYNPYVSIRQATNLRCCDRNPLYSVFRHIDHGRIVVFSKQRSVTNQFFADYESAFVYVECLCFESHSNSVFEADFGRIFDVKKGVFNNDDDDRVEEEEEEEEEAKTGVFVEMQLYKKTTSVGSNTHTKQWNPTVNDKNDSA